jgi:cobyric acid synthase
MLGRWLYDPWMKQGDKPIAEGFGFLPHSTFFGAKMLNVKTTATLLVGAGAGGEITGEEHRSGFSWTPDGACGFAPMLAIRSRTPFEGKASAAPTPENCRLVPGSEPFDGMVTNDRQIWATYVHCICANPAFQRSFLTCHL